MANHKNRKMVVKIFNLGVTIGDLEALVRTLAYIERIKE